MKNSKSIPDGITSSKDGEDKLAIMSRLITKRLKAYPKTVTLIKDSANGDGTQMTPLQVIGGQALIWGTTAFVIATVSLGTTVSPVTLPAAVIVALGAAALTKEGLSQSKTQLSKSQLKIADRILLQSLVAHKIVFEGITVSSASLIVETNSLKSKLAGLDGEEYLKSTADVQISRLSDLIKQHAAVETLTKDVGDSSAQLQMAVDFQIEQLREVHENSLYSSADDLQKLVVCAQTVKSMLSNVRHAQTALAGAKALSPTSEQLTVMRQECTDKRLSQNKKALNDLMQSIDAAQSPPNK